jgi:hypothetical protein
MELLEPIVKKVDAEVFKSVMAKILAFSYQLMNTTIGTTSVNTSICVGNVTTLIFTVK